MPDVLLTGDSPTDPMIPNDVHSDPIFNHEGILEQDWVKVSVVQQLGDAMEDNPPGELQTMCGERGEGNEDGECGRV